MTVAELKRLLKELTELYFTGATVTYTKQSFAVKPTKPLVTITLGSVDRPLNPPMKVIDGRPVALYPATMPVQIDLFTQGRQTEIGPGYTPIVEDTAEDDMLGFASFLNSEYVIQWCHRHDLALVVPPTVQNLTGLINDTNYEFRSMLEISARFTMTAIGYTGTLSPDSVKHITIGPDGTPEEVSGGDIQADDVTRLDPTIEPTPSGGGNEEMASEEGDYFTNVEINDKPVMKEET